MSTLKTGSDRTKDNGKKTVIRILEELLGEPDSPIKLYLNAEDKKRDDDALAEEEKYKLKRDSEREAWEAGKEERDAAAKTADESKFDDNVGENTVDNDNFRTSGNAGFRFQGEIDANARSIIRNIITQTNEILRLADLKIFDDKNDPDTVVIYTLDTNYDKTALTGTEKVSVPQLYPESSDLQKTENSNL